MDQQPAKPTIASLVEGAGDQAGIDERQPLPTAAELEEMRTRCLGFAESHIADAEVLLANDRPSGAYILASLGLEEIGKAEMQFMKVNSGVPFIDEQAGAIEDGETDHRRKLTFAFFFALNKSEMPTPDHAREARRLADAIYTRRTTVAYSPSMGEPAAATVTMDDAKPLVQLARARLQMAKAVGIAEPDDQRREEVKWFFENLHNRAFRHYVDTSRPAGRSGPNDPDWLTTIRQGWAEQTREGFEVLRDELTRDPPQGQDAERRRWKISVRFESGWHRFRPKAFTKWNEGDVPFTFETNPKDDRQLIVHLKLQEQVPLRAVWHIGHDMARLVLLSLSIGAMGFFWWRVSKHKTKFCEGVVDLERGGMFVIERKDAGSLDWGGERTLSQEQLEHAGMCFALLAHRHTPGRRLLLESYDLAMGAWAMHDMHLNLAPTAFDYFFKAYGVAMREFRGWTDASVVEPLRDFFSRVGDAEDRDPLLAHVAEWEQEQRIPYDIGIKFAVLMKIATDAIIIKAAQDELKRLFPKQA